MTAALRTLLAGLIDYAGLFPPAGLPMDESVTNYLAYCRGADAWALARFVLPVVRLGEFEAALPADYGGVTWRLAVLAQATDADVIRAFNTRHAGKAHIGAVESAASSTEDVEALAPLAALADVFVEVPVRDNPSALIAALTTHGLRAKIRTGGVTTSSFPSAAQVARFLVVCARERATFKATAGLHHPLCGDYPLTYETGAVRGPMMGFLNLFFAAGFAQRGMEAGDLERLLSERDGGAFRFSDAGAAWRTHTLSTAEMATLRATFALSFGSCSFREPLDDLSALVLS